MRSRFGADTVAKNDALRRILSLKRNGIRTFVGFIADQGPKPVNIHHWMTFLHQDTPVFTGAERIGKKVGAAAYFLHITRPRRGYYVCRFECLTRCMAQHPDYEFTDLFYRLSRIGSRQVFFFRLRLYYVRLDFYRIHQPWRIYPQRTKNS